MSRGACFYDRHDQNLSPVRSAAFYALDAPHGQEPDMTDGGPGPLQAPRRNKYFSGELLGVAEAQLEQTYEIYQRKLLNRLTLGTGVLQGLTVTAPGDGTLNIAPGVALDGWGRVIIVPTPCVGIDPAQPTDDNQTPIGDRITGGPVTVYLGYSELDGDPTPGGPKATIETYRVIVRPGLPAEAPNQAPVVLATVRLPQDCRPLSIDDRSCRVEIVSNRVLFDLITALEERVRALCGGTPIADTDPESPEGTDHRRQR
jgi:hypothetical protein